MTWLLSLLTPFRAIWGYIVGAVGFLIALWAFAARMKAQGKAEKEAEDREETAEAVRRKRDHERASRYNPPSADELREQRDRIKKFLRLKRPTNNK